MTRRIPNLRRRLSAHLPNITLTLAIVVTINFKQGLWGWVQQRWGWSLFPTRRHLITEAQHAQHR